MVAAAIGLLVTGLLKVLDIVMGTVKPRANVVFPFIDDDVLFPLTGLLEVVVAVYVLLSRGAHPVRSLASLAWIGSLFLLYRVGLAVYGEGACGLWVWRFVLGESSYPGGNDGGGVSGVSWISVGCGLWRSHHHLPWLQAC